MMEMDVELEVIDFEYCGWSIVLLMSLRENEGMEWD
jgi:hypothetical protein